MCKIAWPTISLIVVVGTCLLIGSAFSIKKSRQVRSVSTILIDPQPPLSAAPLLICLDTNFGQIDLLLHPHDAPRTVANFLQYAKEGYYDNTIFHRVINGFIIKGGKYTTQLQQKKTHAPIPNEANTNLRHRAGTIAMHRSSHNPHSATTEFFINVTDNDIFNIPNGYTVFGHVISGMSIVKEIAKLPTNDSLLEDLPQVPVIIEHVRVHHPDTPCLWQHPLLTQYGIFLRGASKG